DLKYPENDVEALARLLTGKGGYDEVVVLTSTRGKDDDSAKPTAQNVREALKNLLARAGKRDLVLIALSGHGVQLRVEAEAEGGRTMKEKEEGYFCLSDARLGSSKDPKELARTMLPLSEIFAQLEECGAGAKLLLFDACRDEPALRRNVDVA